MSEMLYPLGVPLRVLLERVAPTVAELRQEELDNFELGDHTPANMRPKRDACDWLSGAPPCMGWWNASNRKDETLFRYWNSEFWSQPTGGGSDTEACKSLKHGSAHPILYRLVRAPWDVDAEGYHPWVAGLRSPLPPDVKCYIKGGRPGMDKFWRLAKYWSWSDASVLGYKLA